MLLHTFSHETSGIRPLV